MQIDELLIKLAGAGSVIAVLVYFILYFKSELKDKNAEIKELTRIHDQKEAAKNQEIKDLNTLLRDSQRETLTAISKMTEVVEHLTELIKSKL